MQALNAAALEDALVEVPVDAPADEPGLLLELHAAKARAATPTSATACRERFTRLLLRTDSAAAYICTERTIP
jgi:hypothetical protein